MTACRSNIGGAPAVAAVIGVLAAAAACTPALNWRDVRPEGAGVTAAFPCKPSVYARRVILAAMPVELVLHACSAEGATWALANAELHDPAKVTVVLEALFGAALENVAAGAPRALPITIPGATPNRAARQASIEGRLPDGRPVSEQVAVFAKGTRVFQATVVGAALPAEALDTFFGALRMTP